MAAGVLRSYMELRMSRYEYGDPLRDRLSVAYRKAIDLALGDGAAEVKRDLCFFLRIPEWRLEGMLSNSCPIDVPENLVDAAERYVAELERSYADRRMTYWSRRIEACERRIEELTGQLKDIVDGSDL